MNLYYYMTVSNILNSLTKTVSAPYMDWKKCMILKLCNAISSVVEWKITQISTFWTFNT